MALLTSYMKMLTKKLIDSVYETISSYSNTFDCRVAISQLPTHGFAVKFCLSHTNYRKYLEPSKAISQKIFMIVNLIFKKILK